MNATTLTTILGLVIAAVGTIGWPIWANRRKVSSDRVSRQSLDSQEVAKMFQAQAERLQTRLDAAAIAHEQEIRAVRTEAAANLAAAESTWRAQHDRDQEQIMTLRDEVHSLYRQLGRQHPGA